MEPRAARAQPPHWSMEGDAKQAVYDVDAEQVDDSNCVTHLVAALRTYRRCWRQRHETKSELLGCYARPTIQQSLCTNIFEWQVGLAIVEHDCVYVATVVWHNLVSMPACTFQRGVFHPNIDPAGQLCISQGFWRPPTRVCTANGGRIGYLLCTLIKILQHPDQGNVGNLRAAWLYQHDKEAYMDNILKNRNLQSKLKP